MSPLILSPNRMAILPNVQAIPSCWRFDENASHRINNRLDVQSNVTHIFNPSHYHQVATTHHASMALARSAFVTPRTHY